MTEDERRRTIQLKLARMESGDRVSFVNCFGRVLARGGPIPSGFFGLDEALVIGGFPRGLIVEIFGPESSGKTSLALQSVAHVQSTGGAAAWIDAERVYDPEFARSLGVEPESLAVVRPESAEDAMEIARRLTLSCAVDLVVVDSAAALVPRLELESGLSSSAGLLTRVLASALTGLKTSAARGDTCVIFLNQSRYRPDSPEPETSAGGPPLKLHASVRISLQPMGRLPGVDGVRVRVRVLKNKLAGPIRETELELLASGGFCREADLLESALRHGLAVRDASGLLFRRQPLGRTPAAARRLLRDDPALRAHLEGALAEVLEFTGGPSIRAAEPGSVPGTEGPGGAG